MARYARQNFMTPKNFTETLFFFFFPREKTLYIPGGSQVIGCNSFFSKKNQVFTFPYFIKIQGAILIF